MPLVELKTNLKSIGFGKDRPNGGDSGQPFIVKKIPEDGATLGGGFINGPLIPVATFNNRAVNPNRPGIGVLSKTSDFILRGGQLSFLRSADDVLRLTKYLSSTNPPSGPLFVAKQQILSKIGVRTLGSGALLNEKPFLPAGILAQAGGNAYGLHTVKQGVNQFRGIKGKPIPGDYFDNASHTNFLRDDSLRSLLFRLNRSATREAPETYKGFSLSPNDQTILSYKGGPGSTLGIGNTRISYANNLTTRTFGKNSRFNVFNNDRSRPFAFLTKIELDSKSSLSRVSEGTQGVLEDFRKPFTKDELGADAVSKIVSVSPSYTKYAYPKRTNIGNPGTHIPTGETRNLIDYTYSALDGKPLDKLNAFPITTFESKLEGANDLIKFLFEVVDNDSPSDSNSFLLFRAFINSFNDSYTATYNPIRYVGRGDNFYNYGGFDRKITFSFTVAAQSKPELIPMYKKLNYLASTLAPDYATGGYMRANLIKLTIGGYLNKIHGFLDSLTFNIPEDSTYEIAIDNKGGYDNTVAQLPHRIDVDASFIPIQDFLVGKADDISNPTQKYISLTSPDGTSRYGDDYGVKDVNFYKGENTGEIDEEITESQTESTSVFGEEGNEDEEYFFGNNDI